MKTKRNLFCIGSESGHVFEKHSTNEVILYKPFLVW